MAAPATTLPSQRPSLARRVLDSSALYRLIALGIFLISLSVSLAVKTWKSLE